MPRRMVYQAERNLGMSLIQKKGGSRLRDESPKQLKKKRKKPLRTRKQKVLRGLYIAVTVVAAVIVAAYIAQAVWIQKPTMTNGGTRVESGGDDGDDSGLGALSAERKEDVWTFLVAGLDTGGGGNTDTMMLVTYDIPNQQLNVMSLPRDTAVNVPWEIKRLNSVFIYARYYDKEGMEFLAEHVTKLVGYAPDFTIVIQWEAVGELVNAIGGVYFDVPMDMNYDDPTQDLYIHLQKGYQLLDGDKAMQLVRFRKNNNGTGYSRGDLERIEVQQAFLKTVIESCLTFNNVTKINELAKVFTKNVETELTVNNLAWFAKQAIMNGLSMDNVNMFTMPNTEFSMYSKTYQNYQSYVTPVVDELLEMVNEYFNPYKEDIQARELDIYTPSSSSSSSSSTTKSSTSTGTTATPTPSPSSAPSETPESSTPSSKIPETSTSPSTAPATQAPVSQTPATNTPTQAPATTAPTQTPATTAPETVTPSEPETGPGMEPTE